MATSSSGGGVQSILQQWKNFDFSNLQKELDETASELANRQDESEDSRKKLVDQSREFKKNTPEDVRKQVTPLLKSFQAEIDSLSKRSKTAEASFLTLYKRIIEAPDPVPAMDQLFQSYKKAQRCGELELENKNLRETLDQYNSEFAEVRNQEVTIRQLKERIRGLEEQTDSIVEARVGEQETASKRFYDERERQLREEKESLSQKLNEAEERANAVQTSLNAAQKELFVLRSRGDELGSAKASEFELIFADVERANQRADTAEKECELLKEKVRILEEQTLGGGSVQGSTVTGEDESSVGDDGQEKKSRIASYELDLASKEKQIGQLLEELKNVNGKLIEAEKRHHSERAELKEQLDNIQRRTETAETALKAQSDYEEIKRELNILKSIELGANDEEEEEETSKSDDMGNKSGPQKSLEMLLLEKNKALQDENASLRNANRALTVQQAPSPPSPSSLPMMYRDMSDDQLNALIASVNDHQQTDQSDLSNLSPITSDLNDFRQRKDSNKSAPPLQNVVKRMACLIGTELVAMYQAQASEEQANNGASSSVSATLDASIKSVVAESRKKSTISSAIDAVSALPAPQSPPDSAMAAMAMDLLASLRSPTPAGFEEALASGVPREVVEYVALYHLQQSVAKKVRESAAAGEVLDTGAVAQRCRVALSTHNIGQRLLAKCILNQSQGSVSELLSKPKPWEKLTEKGKESFRRIQAWLSDDSSIELLRMISPKRAYGGFRERYPLKQEDMSTQEKINAILSEAHNTSSKSELRSPGFMDSLTPSQLISHRNSNNYSPESRQTSTPNSTTAGGSSSSKNAIGKSSGRYRHDDIPKEMVYEIYRRELEKLQAQDTTGGASSTADVKPTPKPPGSNSMASKMGMNQQKRFQVSQSLLASATASAVSRSKPRRPEPKRLSGLSLSFVQRRPQHSTTVSSILKNNQLLAMRQRSLFNNSRRAENRAGMRLPPVRPSWSANKPKFLSPTTVRVDDSMNIGSTGPKSPSTIGQEEMPPQSYSPGGTPIIGTRLFKAILPPISQEQFEEYTNLDTEDLVRRIKDYLTKYSISQRLFGEQVLGLSQGSVSDLLARPKLWSMLTQKGREPFIRMQLFLNDKKALQKLMEKRQQQLQNGIGDGGENGMESFSGDEGSAAFALPPPTPVAAIPTIGTPQSANRNRRKPALPRSTAPMKEGNRPRELSGIAALLQQAMRGGTSNAARVRPPANSMAPKTAATTTRRYIPASAIPEPDEPIDTMAIVTQIKALLLAHNIGQKVFGATVLDMSQGAVSDLLSKTKPWELMSARGREAILRMKAWLEDPNRLEKVFQGRTPPQPKDANANLEKEFSTVRETSIQQKELIEKLEDDLMRVNTLQRPEAIGAESPDDVTRDFLTKAISPTNVPLTESSAADSLLPIVAGQRERFRQRVQELEEQNLQYQQHLALLQTETERSRADNVKLYEKIKFLQSYRGGAGNQTALSMADDQTLQKYSSEYEQTLDPFRRFGVQERQRKYQALRTHDKATLRISRVIMSSGTARAFFFFYLLFLHCLVFLVLYKTAYTESCKRDFNTECVQKFREHMHQVHGQEGHSD